VPNAIITGTGFFVPPRIVTNDDLVTEFGVETSHEWIHQRTGIEQRHFAEEGVGGVELAVPAAQMAIAAAGLRPCDIDMILYATLSPRHVFPGDGVYLQAALGMPEGPDAKFVPALDIRNQCSGFLYGLATATSMVQSGRIKHVLLVGAECHSHALDLSTEGRTVGSLFGDGAGAVIVSATDEDRGVRGWWLGADGRHADALAQRVFDTRRTSFVPKNDAGEGIIAAEDMYATMNGRLVYKHAVEKMMSVLMQACAEQHIELSDIDLFVFHQANMRINQQVQAKLGLPDEKVVHNIQRYGNTTAATIPILLAETVRDGRLKPGMKVACVAFGAGFTWGAALIDW